MGFPMRFLFFSAFTLLLSFYVSLPASFAEVTTEFTEPEIQSLPDLIELKLRAHLDLHQKVKNSKSRALAQKYIDKYGWGYNTLHHFGKGLIYLNRYKKIQNNPHEKAVYLKYAIGELSFSIKPRKVKTYSKLFIFTFLPSIYFKRGEAYLFNNDVPEAINDFLSVIKIKPTFYQAYLKLSECYRRLGDNENAEKILLLGEQHARKK